MKNRFNETLLKFDVALRAARNDDMDERVRQARLHTLYKACKALRGPARQIVARIALAEMCCAVIARDLNNDFHDWVNGVGLEEENRNGRPRA